VKLYNFETMQDRGHTICEANVAREKIFLNMYGMGR